MVCSVNLACAIVAVCLTCFVASDSIYDALERKKHLSEFFSMVGQEAVLVTLLDSRHVTLFAPTNEAIRKAKARKPDDFKRESLKVPGIYVLNMLALKKDFPFRKAPYLAGVAPLYMNIKEEDHKPKEYFVNNAKIISQEEYRGTGADSQMLYVIDDILEPYIPISSQPPTALALLKQPSIYGLKEPLDAFATRVTSEIEKEIFNRVGNNTFFLPVGSADEASKIKLQEIDTWVVRSHVISKHALFLRAMSRKTYKSETWGDNLKVELKIVNDSPNEDIDKWYIQSNTIQGDARHRKGVVRAKVVRANIPVNNGVVHLISNPLVVIDKTIWEHIEEQKTEKLSQFYSLASNHSGFLSHLKNSDQRTVFAPTDEAFNALKGVSMDKYHRVFSNQTEISKLLDLHMVMRSVATEDVWNKNVTAMQASDNRRYIYFGVVGDERNKTLTVEGGGVNATAIMGDIGATNGILHVIDRVFGMPYLTLYSKLAHDPDLHTTYRLSMQDYWNLKLDEKDKRYTFFAPSRKAWEDLKREMPSEHKQLNLGQFSYHVHKILDRHLVVGKELTKDDLQRQGTVQMVHGTFQISTGFQSGSLKVEWEGLEAHIVRPDVQATNGIIHVIDRVMIKRRDLTKSAAASWSPSVIALVLSVIFVFIKIKL